MLPKTLNILHIDPEPHMTELLKLILGFDDINIDGCRTFKRALEIMLNEKKQKKYNIIVLEVFEKKASDGFNFIYEILKYNIDIPIIIISLCSQTVYKNKARELRVEEYLTKPMNPNEIEKAIKKAYLKYLKLKMIIPKKRVKKLS